jgi:hypothetical protein
MILLTVIMALGLAGILKENTLGTLLGGIGGYVLSQGVGKAAAEAVKSGLIAGGAQGGALATPPVITALAPVVGPPDGGSSVKITGAGFATGATVTFGGTKATITNVASTTIDVTTPAHTAGAVDVVVTNPDNQSAKSPSQFTYQ